MACNDKQLARLASNQMDQTRQDYREMSSVISNLHKKYKSTTEECHHGQYVISESKFERWARAKAREICPSDNDLQRQVAEKLIALSYVDCGAENCIKVQLDYTCGGRQSTKCVFLVAKGLENDKIAVVYGLYAYEWNEADNWRLRCEYWETDEKKKQLKNWVLYRAAKRAYESITSS
eukprot:80339_1